MSETAFTPPGLAKRWKCKASTVLALLKSGRLHGFTLGAGRRRPRWRISPESVAAFEKGQRQEPVKNGRRRKTAGEVIDFF